MSAAAIAIAGLKVYSDFIAPFKGHKAQKKAAKADQVRRMLDARRQRIALARQSQLVAATNINTAANEGTTGSSADLGALASVAAQSGAEQGYLSAFDMFSHEVSRQKQKAANYEFYGQMAGSLADFAESSAGQSAGAKVQAAGTKIKSLFS